MEKLTVGSCFSGIGGLELGLEWTGGFETKWQIENDKDASIVLQNHWRDATRFGDIKTADFERLGAVDVVCGGFPCQDISDAGGRTGISGNRSGLWSELLRAICVVRPKFAVVENVAALLHRGMGTVLGDMARSRYDAQWDCLSACELGAPHTRERVFIVAQPRSTRREWRWLFESGKGGAAAVWKSNSGSIKGSVQGTIWSHPPDPLDRVAYGLSKKVAFRLLGNAVVPQVAQKIGEMILNSIQGEL